MKDQDIEDLLPSMRGQDPPPAAPTDRMWAAIENRVVWGPRARRFPVWFGRPLALAATLLLGVGIGYSVGRSGPHEGPASLGSGVAVGELSAGDEYLADAAALLTPLAGDDPAVLTPAMQERARQLLSTTRMVLDTRVTDPALRSLLEDLELVLAQMVPFSAQLDDGDVRLVNQALTERAVMPRLSRVIAISRGDQ
ncbi:MAG: hypothetical protein ACKVZ0_17330 [Gemmatimonadales bacterium]